MRSEDVALRLAADVLDDIERVRIANENRLRAIEQGEMPEHPIVSVVIRSQVEQFKLAEKETVAALQKSLRLHPLGPWVKRTVGIGEKQGARLIAAIGDPYWHPLHDRPRRVGELWAYTGLHTLPVSNQDAVNHREADTGTQLPIIHPLTEAQTAFDDRSQLAVDHSSHDSHYGHVDGAQLSDVDQHRIDIQKSYVYIAAKRRRGTRANWSGEAKMRAYLCAESCIKQLHSPYRAVYDRRKAATVDRTHVVPCPQCDGAGSRKTGTPWRDGHRHADALRIVAKAILKDMWKAARDARSDVTSAA